MERLEISEIFKHPLLLMIVGAILSYLIIPAINSISEKEKRINEQKINLAYKIIDQNTEVSKNLNALFVTLELFYKDHKHLSDLNTLNASRELTHSEMLKLYLHFDSEAWFWEQNFIIKTSASELNSEDLSLIKTSIRNYQENLVGCTAFIDTLWKSTLRISGNFQPGLQSLFASANDTLKILSDNRKENIKDIVKVLTGSGR
jgi:hypothetical protein